MKSDIEDQDAGMARATCKDCLQVKKVTPISSWGKKKMERYEELCNEGLKPEVAYMCVEDFKGDKSKIHGEFL